MPVTLSIFALPTKTVQKESKENQPSDSVLPLFSWMINCLELIVWVNDSMTQSLVWFKNESVFWGNHWLNHNLTHKDTKFWCNLQKKFRWAHTTGFLAPISPFRETEQKPCRAPRLVLMFGADYMVMWDVHRSNLAPPDLLANNSGPPRLISNMFDI